MNVLLIANRQLERQGPGDAKLGYWAWKHRGTPAQKTPSGVEPTLAHSSS